MVSLKNMNAARLFREEQQRQSGILTIYTRTLSRKTGPFLLVLDLCATDTSKGVHITVHETRDPQQRNPQLKFNSTNQGGKKIPPPIPERIHNCKNEKRKTSTRTEKEQIMGMPQEPSRTQKSPHVTNFN